MRRTNRVVLIRNGYFLSKPSLDGTKLCWTDREENAKRFASVESASKTFEKYQKEYGVTFFLNDWSFASLLSGPTLEQQEPGDPRPHAHLDGAPSVTFTGWTHIEPTPVTS